MIVNLTKDEYQFALKLGKRRHETSTTFTGRAQRANEFSSRDHTLGALSEAAVAKLFGVDLSTKLFQFGTPDFIYKDKKIGVRGSTKPELVIRPVDHNDYYYVLVVAHPNNELKYTICGYILGETAKKYTEYFSDRTQNGVPRNSPAWFIPADKLDPIADIVKPG